MSEFNPAQVESLLETRSRLQRLLSFAESGMKSSAVSLIKKHLLNSKSGDAGFFVGVMNSVWDTPLRENLQDCLWALLSMRGRPAPQLFGKNGLYPNLPAHEQWHKSIAVLKGTVASLDTVASEWAAPQKEQAAIESSLVETPPIPAEDVIRVDAREMLRDAEEVLRFLKRLPSEARAQLKHSPTSFLFQSFFDFVERLMMHMRPISDNCPAVEQGPVILDGISDGDRAEFLAWSQSLENLLREICLERFGARFFFATRIDTGERLIHFESRELTAFSPSRAGLPNPEVASLAKLQTADIDGLNQFISELSELVDRARSVRTIIPATKENAAWSVSRMLADVLAWATYPDPHRLSLGWWDANKANAERVLNSAVSSFTDDECTLKKIHEIRSLTLRLLGLLYHNPTLSTVPVQDWPVKAYQSLFDDLSEFEREFRIRGNAQPASQNPEAAPDNSKSAVSTPEAIPPAFSTVQPDAGGSGIPPVFTGPWKHLYTFLWQQDFDLSQSQDDYKAVFETYRSAFGKKKTGSGKRKRTAYKMPSSSGAKTIRQGYRRQLKLHQARQ